MTDTVRISREDLEGMIISAYIALAILTIDPELVWAITENLTDVELDESMSNFILEEN